MAVDPKQILGAFLTITMFAMLGNMIKRDHFDPLLIQEVKVLPGNDHDHGVGDDAQLVQTDDDDHETSSSSTVRTSSGPWKQTNQPPLRPCWNKLPSKLEQEKGFVAFSLTTGPHYHTSQVADAVSVAWYLGATLLLPNIQGSNPSQNKKFEEIYDANKFIESLRGINVSVAKDQTAAAAADFPMEINESALQLQVMMRVPNRPTEDFIANQVSPLFRSANGNLRLSSYFPANSLNMKIRGNQMADVDSASCLGMFGTLQLQPSLREIADTMVERLRILTHKSDGRFIAVDLRIDMLNKKGCQRKAIRKKSTGCFTAAEVGSFLKKIGFTSDTVIYLTQSRWHNDLNEIKHIFPRTYTKESIIPSEKRNELLLNSESNLELEKALDFYICSESDVFVPAISGLFYANVAGQRIAGGRIQILVPTRNPTSDSASDYLSPYVTDKNHLAYSCFCG